MFIDFEKITENLVRRAMEEYKLQDEYQIFLDFLLQSLDMERNDSEEGKDQKMRALIDSLIP